MKGGSRNAYCMSTGPWSQLEGKRAACLQNLPYDQGTLLPRGQVMHLRVCESVQKRVR